MFIFLFLLIICLIVSIIDLILIYKFLFGGKHD